jgi:hypothetical protein
LVMLFTPTTRTEAFAHYIGHLMPS